MERLREALRSRLNRLFVVLACLCLPLALGLSRVRSYTATDQFGHLVRTRAHPRYGSFWMILLSLLLAVAALRLLLAAIRWVTGGSARQ